MHSGGGYHLHLIAIRFADNSPAVLFSVTKCVDAFAGWRHSDAVYEYGVVPCSVPLLPQNRCVLVLDLDRSADESGPRLLKRLQSKAKIRPILRKVNKLGFQAGFDGSHLVLKVVYPSVVLLAWNMHLKHRRRADICSRSSLHSEHCLGDLLQVGPQRTQGLPNSNLHLQHSLWDHTTRHNSYVSSDRTQL